MNQLEWLKQDLNKLENHIDQRFSKVDEKIDALLKFKWQIMGSTSVVALVVGVVIQIFIAVAAK
jgi:hypothetical protein